MQLHPWAVLLHFHSSPPNAYFDCYNLQQTRRDQWIGTSSIIREMELCDSLDRIMKPDEDVIREKPSGTSIGHNHYSSKDKLFSFSQILTSSYSPNFVLILQDFFRVATFSGTECINFLNCFQSDVPSPFIFSSGNRSALLFSPSVVFPRE